MSLKIFVHYSPDGEIYAMTHEDERFFQQRLDAGEPILEIEQQLDFKRYKIDLDTMTLVEKPPVTPAIISAYEQPDNLLQGVTNP